MDAYKNLGYYSMREAHAGIARVLDMNQNTVKNMRDQFDPLHGFRKGWYQKPLSSTREKVVEALQYLTEFEIRAIVADILKTGSDENQEDISNLLSIVQNDEEGKYERVFTPRGPTGAKAEKFFIQNHKKFGLPEKGLLEDTRDLGTGYDFKIIRDNKIFYIEVKGISEISGGILLTSKEWESAKTNGDKFYLAIVSGLNNKPSITFIQDPYNKIRPKKSIIKTVQINWSVSKSEIETYLNN